MSEWKEVQLNETCNLIAGYAFKSKDFGNYPTKVLKIADINPPFVSSEKSSGVDLSNYDVDKLDKYIVKKGDYILAMTGATIGKLGRYVSDEHAYLNQRVLKFQPYQSIDSNFSYYVLCGRLFAKYIINHIDSESAQPNISAGTIGKYRFNLPDFKTQQEIASILSSLDSKIENNRKICANLEAQAQALFKHWFIDFAPFKDGKFVESELGMIPEGWRVGKLTDILENIKDTTKQGDYPELPYLPIDSIPMNSFLVKDIKDNSEAQSSLILFKKYDILIGAMRVYFHRVIPAPFDGITRSTCFVVRPKVWNYYSFALCSVNSNQAILHAQKTSKGSTMPYAVWEGGLGAFSIVIPPESVAREFDYLIKKYINIIQYAYFENQKLTTLRDTLLPKLMSGEIKVLNFRK